MKLDILFKKTKYVKSHIKLCIKIKNVKEVFEYDR